MGKGQEADTSKVYDRVMHISSCFLSRGLGIQLKLKVITSYISVIPSCEGNSGVAHVYSMREENPLVFLSSTSASPPFKARKITHSSVVGLSVKAWHLDVNLSDLPLRMTVT